MKIKFFYRAAALLLLPFFFSAPATAIHYITESMEIYRVHSEGFTVFEGADDITITLIDAFIDVDLGCALRIEDNAKVNLVLQGNNTLISSNGFAGLQVAERAILTISGSGTLTAIGNKGAGIGGGFGNGYGYNNCGTVIINSGTITATGTNGCAGIGGGFSGNSSGSKGGTITINNGTVKAKATGSSDGGGDNNPGIGGSNSSIVIIKDGTIEASSDNSSGIGGNNGNITINSGIITATGKNNSGIDGNNGNITINGGMITATGSASSSGIGGNSNTNITINGGSVKSTMGVQPKNKDGTPLYYLTDEVEFFTALSDGAITNLSITIGYDKYEYGAKDVAVRDGGMLYFWLPATSYAERSIQITQGTRISNNKLLLFHVSAENTVNLDTGLSPNGFTQSSAWKFNGNVLNITKNGTFVITGNSSVRTVTVEAFVVADVTFESVNLDMSDTDCPFLIATGAQVRLTLAGSNSLKSAGNTGIHVAPAATLTILPGGDITVTGGGNCTAIGGYNGATLGNIIINGGRITATGGSTGIGNANVTVNGGMVTATGSENSPGIDAGNGKVTITGGSVISSINPIPLNAAGDRLFFAEIDFGFDSENIPITSITVNVDSDAYAYGIKDMTTGKLGKVQMWLQNKNYPAGAIKLTHNDGTADNKLFALCEIKFAITSGQPGFSIFAAYDGRNIKDGTIITVDGSNKLTVKVSNTTGMQYKYTWSLDGASETVLLDQESLTILDITGSIDVKCHITGPYFPVKFALDGPPIFNGTVTHKGETVANGEGVPSGDKVVIRVSRNLVVDPTLTYRYIWSGTGIPENAFVDRDSLVIESLADAVDVTCKIITCYNVKFSLAGNTAGFDIVATSNGDTIRSNTAIPAGSRIVITVVNPGSDNAGADLNYRYIWTGTGVQKDVPTEACQIAVTLDGHLSAVCIVTSPYYTISYGLLSSSDGFAITATANNRPFESGDSIRFGSKIEIKIIGESTEFPCDYAWSGDIPAGVARNANVLALTVTGDINVRCDVTGPYYPVNFTLEAPEGITLEATVKSIPISSGDSVMTGDRVEIKIAGEGEKTYRYTWTGEVQPDFTTDKNSLTIDKLAAPVDIKCTVTGPYYAVIYAFVDSPSGLVMSVQSDSVFIESGKYVLTGSKITATVTGGDPYSLYSYNWLTGNRDAVWADSSVLVIDSLSQALYISCTVTETGKKPVLIKQPAVALKTSLVDGILRVEGLRQGAVWQVYNLIGTLLYRGVSNGETTNVKLHENGIYILVAGQQRIKITGSGSF
jgi:hypothetical protein